MLTEKLFRFNWNNYNMTHTRVRSINNKIGICESENKMRDNFRSKKVLNIF